MALQVQPRKLPLGISPEDLDALLRRAQQTSANQPEQTPVEPTNTIQKRLLQAAPQIQPATVEEEAARRNWASALPSVETSTTIPGVSREEFTRPNPIVDRLRNATLTETILPPTEATRLRHETRPSPLMDASRIAANVPLETPVAATDSGVIQKPTNVPLSAVPPGLKYSSGDEVRARQLNEPDELTKAVDALRDRQNAPLYNPDESGVIQKPHGLKAHLLAALKMAGRGFERGGLPGAVSGAIEGAVDPTLPAQIRRQQQIAAAGQNVNQQAGIAGERAKINAQNAETATRIDTLRRAPQERRQKADELERDNLRGIYINLDEFDPVNNPDDKAIAERSRALGQVLPAKAKGEVHKPIERLAKDKMSYQRYVWNPKINDYEPQMIGGEPVITRQVSPLDSQGISANTRYSADAARGRYETSRKDRQEEQDYQRGRDVKQDARQDAREQRQTQAEYDKEYNAASAMLTHVNSLRARASAAKTAEERSAYYEAADELETQLKTQYGDYVEGSSMSVSGDGLGVDMAASARDAMPLRLKARTPRAAAPARSQSPYAGRHMSKANATKWATENGYKSLEEALPVLQDNGVIID